MASTKDLPVETFLQIVGYLDIGDLAAIALTCRGFYTLANPLLYKLEAQRPGSHTFYAAAESGHIGRMRKLINAGFEVNKVWHEPQPLDWPQATAGYWTALHLAAAKGEDGAVAFLIDNGADMNAASKSYCDCQYFVASACCWDHVNHINVLLPLWSPLHQAICHGQLLTAHLLLSRGASSVVEIDERGELDHDGVSSNAVISDTSASSRDATSRINQSRCTALHNACRLGLFQLVRFLIEDGFQLDVDVKDRIGQTPLMYATSASDLVSTIPYLLSKGAHIEGKGPEIVASDNIFPGTPLLLACNAPGYGVAIDLVRLGADVNFVHQRCGNSPLHISIYALPTWGSEDPNIDMRECLELVNKLMKAGARVNIQNRDGHTPLSCAAQRLHRRIAETLLRHGADVSIPDANDCTPLALACSKQCYSNRQARQVIKMVRLLIQHGADVNARSRNNLTALHHICNEVQSEPSAVEIIGVLRSYGADITLKNDLALLPFQTVFYRGWADACALLFNEQVRTLLTSTNIDSMYSSILVSQIRNSSSRMIKLLLDIGGSCLLSRPETLNMALNYGRKDLFPLLVDKQTFMAFVSNSQGTVLHLGCQLGLFRRNDMIADLFEASVEFDVDVTNHNGDSLLYTYMEIARVICPRDQLPAVKAREYPATVRQLLKQGADPHQFVRRYLRDDGADYSHCERPLDLAFYRLQDDVVCRTLATHPIRGDTSGYSYLHRACSFEKQPASDFLVRLLLKDGLDANGINCFGETPLFHMLHTFRPGPPTSVTTGATYGPFLVHHYMAVDHIDKLLHCIDILEEFGAKWSVRNRYPRDGRSTPIEALQFLLDYDGDHTRSYTMLQSLRERLLEKEWDIEDVGEDFFLLLEDDEFDCTDEEDDEDSLFFSDEDEDSSSS